MNKIVLTYNAIPWAECQCHIVVINIRQLRLFWTRFAVAFDALSCKNDQKEICLSKRKLINEADKQSMFILIGGLSPI
jgi:hypothetical protein